MTVQEALGVLGVNASASDDEIRKAYRDLVAIWHPDRHAGNERLRLKAEEQVKILNVAYELLRDDSWRRVWGYDAFQEVDDASGGSPSDEDPEAASTQGDEPAGARAGSRMRDLVFPLLLTVALLIPVAIAVRDATVTNGTGSATPAPILDGEAVGELLHPEDSPSLGASTSDSAAPNGGGTSSEASILIGRWVFEPSAEQKAQMGDTIPSSEFVFTADGKFKMTGTSGTESVSVIGSWKLDGKKATLTPESLGGKKPENEMERKPLVITLWEDGKYFTPEDSGVPARYVRK
ncbi:MAG: DnaJ domain-containing protein [Armatimonadetes bacterium]|nr:hypothetical protein [Armatimonadota bacterium]NOG92816.1 DnaJ domain-containing protein [Armatimonadota bacterium]